jgi:hypothetical protein
MALELYVDRESVSSRSTHICSGHIDCFFFQWAETLSAFDDADGHSSRFDSRAGSRAQSRKRSLAEPVPSGTKRLRVLQSSSTQGMSI